MMARLRRCQKLGERLGGFVLKIAIWRTGRRYEVRASVADRAGTFGCRLRRRDWSQALHDLVRAVLRQLHDQCLRRHAA